MSMKKPNIVWIYCDELRADALGCYGNEVCRPRTPNLDRLAGSGVRFENCFTNSPICVSARMAEMSARYPVETGVYANEPAMEACTYPNPPVTFPEVFAKAGYATANFGKLHLPRGMQPWGVHNREGHGIDLIAKDVVPGTMLLCPGPGTKIGGRYPGDRPYPAAKVTDNALEWMGEQDGPYLVRVSYLQPHTPVCPPPPYDDMYPPEDFPGSFPDEGVRSRFERRFSEIMNWGKFSEEHTRLAQAYYYGLTSWMDSQVGRVLDWLEQRGELEDTLIVFDADHGASLGEFGCYGKHLFAPRTHRIPRIASWPARLPSGEVREDVCEGLDTARTLLGAAGIDAPEEFRGRDLFDSEEPEGVYATIGHGEKWSVAFPYKKYGLWHGDVGWPRRSCVRTRRWRLDMSTRMDGRTLEGEERDVFLADRESDPLEIRNLAEDPAHAEVRDRLLALLEKHVANSVEDACVFDESLFA